MLRKNILVHNILANSPVTSITLVWRPANELWETSHPPDGFPSGSVRYPVFAWGPINPAALSVSVFSFSFSALMLSVFLWFSCSQYSRYILLSRAPCVTRLIKTNTDPIFLSNPIVPFFPLPSPGACMVLGILGAIRPRLPPPFVTDLRFQTLRKITYCGQIVNKVLLNGNFLFIEPGFRLFFWYVSIIIVTKISVY